MDKIANLRASYQHLCAHIDSFTEFLLAHGELISATVYTMPTYTNLDIDAHPSNIELIPVHGKQALLESLDWMKKNSITNDQSGRIVPRLPGVIVYQHPEPLECIMRLERINVLKNDLNEAIIDISADKDIRFETVKMALPNLIKKVATRHFLFANRPVNTVSFTWAHRLTGENKTKQQVMAILQRSLDYSNKNTIADPMFSMRVEQDKLMISQLPQQSVFAIRRPIRVTPMLNLNYRKGSTPYLHERPSSKNALGIAPRNFVAHSPVFIFNDLPKVFPFKSYNQDEHPKPEPAHLDKEVLVIERLHLYLKKLS